MADDEDGYGDDATLEVGDESFSVDDIEVTTDADAESFLDSLEEKDEPSPELRELSSAISEASKTPRGRRREAEVLASDPDPGMVGMAEDAATPDHATYESFSLDIEPDVAQTLLRHIYSVVEERHQQGHRVEQVVIGMPQYKILEPWAQAVFECSIEDVLSSLTVTVVPGPMIHAVIDNKQLLTEDLRS